MTGGGNCNLRKGKQVYVNRLDDEVRRRRRCRGIREAATSYAKLR